MHREQMNEPAVNNNSNIENDDNNNSQLNNAIDQI